MKKLLGILVLGLLVCRNSFAVEMDVFKKTFQYFFKLIYGDVVLIEEDLKKIDVSIKSIKDLIDA